MGLEQIAAARKIAAATSVGYEMHLEMGIAEDSPRGEERVTLGPPAPVHL